MSWVSFYIVQRCGRCSCAGSSLQLIAGVGSCGRAMAKTHTYRLKRSGCACMRSAWTGQGCIHTTRSAATCCDTSSGDALERAMRRLFLCRGPVHSDVAPTKTSRMPAHSSGRRVQSQSRPSEYAPASSRTHRELVQARHDTRSGTGGMRPVSLCRRVLASSACALPLV